MSINFCRLCRCKGSNLIHIFENDSKTALEIFLITGIKIVEIKSQTALICQECQLSLSAAIKFRSLCQSTEESLKKSSYDNETEFFSKELENLIKSKEGDDEVQVKCEQIFTAYEGNIEKYARKKDTSRPNQKFFCDQCGKEYVHKNALKNHLHRYHSDSLIDVGIESSTALKISHSTKSKGSHKIKMQNEKSQHAFICPICAKIFKTRSNLSQHEKTHKILLPSQYFYCDLCGNKFREKGLMAAHIKNRHIHKIRFQCQLCVKNYATKFHLSTHLKVIHMGFRDFKCNYCEKEFGEKKKLVAHERVHTGEQPFSCKYCDRKFTHQTDYRRHQWNHENHKRFICQNQNCNQGFMKRAELQSHMNRCRIN